MAPTCPAVRPVEPLQGSPCDSEWWHHVSEAGLARTGAEASLRNAFVLMGHDSSRSRLGGGASSSRATGPHPASTQPSSGSVQGPGPELRAPRTRRWRPRHWKSQGEPGAGFAKSPRPPPLEKESTGVFPTPADRWDAARAKAGRKATRLGPRVPCPVLPQLSLLRS